MLHLDKAAVVVSFDADFLGGHPAQVRYAADWVSRRRSADDGQMSRVYVFETALTLTGSGRRRARAHPSIAPAGNAFRTGQRAGCRHARRDRIGRSRRAADF